MHRGHDHDHHHHHGNGAGNGHSHVHNHAPPPKAAQWQTPHAPGPSGHDHREPDLDLVEMAFVEGFGRASDPASFLRLARIPFEARDRLGNRLVLLRVETDAVTDVGAPGTVRGVTLFDGTDGALDPTAFVATTVKV